MLGPLPSFRHKARESDPEAAHHASVFITRLYEIEPATADADVLVRHAASL
jgi:hypothetical protein